MKMKMKMKMKIIERNEKGFASFTLVAGSHDHQETRVWVHETLVKKEVTGTDSIRVNESGFVARFEERPRMGETISFPIHSARITRTEKGGLVLRPTPGWTVHLIEEDSGYRGSCSVELDAGEIIASGKSYHSPQGNLGETAWALVNVQGPVRVTGRRTGRRIDKEGIDYTLHTDGTVVEAEEEGLQAELA